MCVLLYIISVCIYSFTSIYIFVIFTATLKKSSEHVSLCQIKQPNIKLTMEIKMKYRKYRKSDFKKRKKTYSAQGSFFYTPTLYNMFLHTS